jgi:hypothetical protein
VDDGLTRDSAIPATLNGTTTTDSTNATGTITRVGSSGTCGPDGHVVWFKWRATESATITATTLGSAYDTVLYLFRDGKFVDCHDDTGLGTDCPAGSGVDHCSKLVFESRRAGATTSRLPRLTAPPAETRT